MTSVTIPSSTGPLHGGYPSVRESVSNSKSEFEASRNVKRCLSFPSTSDSKKRRKQSTPLRIYNNETGSVTPTPCSSSQSNESTSSDIDIKCPVCQLDFDNADLLQNHIACEHYTVEFKKEPDEEPRDHTPSSSSFAEAPLCLTMPKSEIPWGGDMPSKDWLNTSMQNLPINAINPVFMAMTQLAPQDNLQLKPIRIFNPDAYCDLCNKEFCNKYFLKTHKANKHGIYSDTPTCEPQQSSTNMPLVAGSMRPIHTPVPSVELNKSEMKSTTKANINSFNVAFSNSVCNKFPKLEEVNDVHVSRPTSTGPSSLNENEKVLPDGQCNEEFYRLNNTQTESTSVKHEPDGNYSDSMKMSPNQNSRETELATRLRRIGVMNPKAFCEICNKEYCNKYFLRTHKIKRHGIYIPDDKETKIDGINPYVQTSPLNLIMTEQSPIYDRKTTSPNDISCDLCGIRFQNISLAQLHNFTVHTRMSSKENEVPSNLTSTNDESKKSPELHKPPDKNLNAEAISEDLQKLQTMIMQLNELDVAKVPTTCTTCNKEFENKFYLHAHMVTEHGVLMEDVTDFEKNGDSESSNNNTYCDLCGKDLQNADEMKKHVLEVHSNNSSGEGKDDFGPDYGSPEKINVRMFMPGTSIPERRMSVNVTPTSSYCEICNKELCNKYFMKTHMQRMHGIEIENGSQIGGVVCDICNKELCSKYFLRVHKHNTHGIVEYGASLLQPRKSETESVPQASTSTPEPDPALKPGDLADLSHRYFTHFTEVCPICSRRFRSTKWLKAHLISDHGQMGIDKWAELEQQLQQTLNQAQTPKLTKPIKTERTSPNLKIPNGVSEMPKKVGIQNVLSSIFGSDDINSKTYQCSYCPFTSPLLPLLFIHERSHTIGNENIPIKCPVCPQSFLERELFQRHMFTQHPFLPLPPLFNGSDSSGEPINQENETPATFKEEDAVPVPKSAAFPKISVAELPLEVNESLKDVAKKVQLPATYALPQQEHIEGTQEENLPTGSPGYVMQAFLLEESTSERRVAPSVVFLPVLQKQPAPLTVTFTLTPA